MVWLHGLRTARDPIIMEAVTQPYDFWHGFRWRVIRDSCHNYLFSVSDTTQIWGEKQDVRDWTKQSDLVICFKCTSIRSRQGFVVACSRCLQVSCGHCRVARNPEPFGLGVKWEPWFPTYTARPVVCLETRLGVTRHLILWQMELNEVSSSPPPPRLIRMSWP